ncbi:ras-related protein Rab-17-like [Mauremys reevesii]|uniref:ras-related protein Rab-17-like n=1 Tax=Mauremys reevesii TaxID=260615 RepID=UPI00193FB619|nr:ras-related protein Rab-17-like [Mauremys reevesii]
MFWRVVSGLADKVWSPRARGGSSQGGSVNQPITLHIAEDVFIVKNMAPRRTQQVGAGPSTEQTYISKVVLLGSAAVGKSSTAFRRVKNDVRESVPTVGCSFFTQLVCLETATIKLVIWDTAGQEKYHGVCHLYYRGANAALLVYDIARKATFARAKLWLRELEKEFLPDELVIVLVGNKIDLAAQREFTFEVSALQ